MDDGAGVWMMANNHGSLSFLFDFSILNSICVMRTAQIGERLRQKRCE